jgi:hypothetical protein
MTWLLASVSCIILWIMWDKHQQMSFPLNNVLLILDNHAISAFVPLNLSLSTNNHHQTNLFHISGLWETPATCSYTRQNSCWVSQTCWLLLIQYWYNADYIFLITSHFFSWSSSSTIPHQQIMDKQPPQPCESGSKSNWLAGASPYTSLIGTQDKCSTQFIHCDAAITATRNMTQDAHWIIVHKTGSCTKMKQHVVGFRYIHTVLNGPRQTV